MIAYRVSKQKDLEKSRSFFHPQSSKNMCLFCFLRVGFVGQLLLFGHGLFGLTGWIGLFGQMWTYTLESV